MACWISKKTWFSMNLVGGKVYLPPYPPSLHRPPQRRRRFTLTHLDAPSRTLTASSRLKMASKTLLDGILTPTLAT